MSEVNINRKTREATLYGGSSNTVFGEPGVTIKFDPRLSDKDIRVHLYRVYVTQLERKAALALRNAEKDLWAASSLSRHEVEDDYRSQVNAGRAHCLTAMLPRVA